MQFRLKPALNMKYGAQERAKMGVNHKSVNPVVLYSLYSTYAPSVFTVCAVFCEFYKTSQH